MGIFPYILFKICYTQIMQIIAVYVSFKNLAEARKIGFYLLKHKLVVCANYFPISSIYLWQGKIEQASEFVGIFKSKKENWSKIKSEIKKLHSYEIPMILKFEIESNSEYKNWLFDELKGRRTS